MKEGIALPRALKENVGPFVSILLLCLPPHGVASDITYHYEGAITSVQNLGGPPPSFLFTSLFAPGRSWTLDFTCNAQAPDLNPSSPNIGFFPGAPAEA